VAATARTKPIGPRLEPRFPLGFQRVDDPGLNLTFNLLADVPWCSSW
jgi:hypothetical protein